MTEIADLMRRNFPNLDSDSFEYLESILKENADSFENSDEVYDAIGEFITEAHPNIGGKRIKQFCEKIFSIILRNRESVNNYNDGEGGDALDDNQKISQNGGAGCDANNLEEGEEGAGVSLIDIINEKAAANKSTFELDDIFMKKAAIHKSYVDQKKLQKITEKSLIKMEKNNPNAFKRLEAKYILEAPSVSQQSSKNSGGSAAAESKNINMELSNTDITLQDIVRVLEGGSKFQDIAVRNFDISYGSKSLLKDANLSLTRGNRYGFVGRNGLGKTTLLRSLASYQLALPEGIRVLHVEQEVLGDDTLVLDSVLEADLPRAHLLRLLEADKQNSGGAGGGKSTTLIYQLLEQIEADKAPARAAIILAGLGFSREMQRRATKTFSGGWRMRVSLARALFAQPDLLLLDEPTNMLDLRAIIWLEQYLTGGATSGGSCRLSPSTILLVVSHDQVFLQAVSTHVLHLTAAHRIEPYACGYDRFVEAKREKLRAQEREYAAQKQLRDHLQVFIDKFRYSAARASLVQSKIKFLESLPELEPPVTKESTIVFRFPEVEKLSPPILKLDEAGFAYPAAVTAVASSADDKNTQEMKIFTSVSISATMTSRICIVGENGAGKTTLLKLLTGDLEPNRGGLRSANRNLRIGYFSQHHVDQLNEAVSSLEFIISKFPGEPSDVYRAHLGAFGVSGELALKPIITLSGGQKSRVAFALMCYPKPNFLVLDEPTNHLDMETIEALAEAIKQYGGGVVLVSHDERLIHLVCNELWMCEKGGRVVQLEGGMREYRNCVEKELASYTVQK